MNSLAEIYETIEEMIRVIACANIGGLESFKRGEEVWVIRELEGTYYLREPRKCEDIKLELKINYYQIVRKIDVLYSAYVEAIKFLEKKVEDSKRIKDIISPFVVQEKLGEREVE